MVDRDQARLDQVYADVTKVTQFVYSIARILLVVRDGELALNTPLATELWGAAGAELCASLTPEALGFPAVDAAMEFEDPFL
ncbi:uncharacterized protein LOC62_01G000211 [Vanrija pseudolonga]|uniref:Uncharacterized protein n=1 Tax=Vanrija pseudolonga TaxID=143232 RepID=A0AAF0Y288_9TREE|nr:hypothetical protein LOC62_01G000211 [Vanrija pseudolonga]